MECQLFPEAHRDSSILDGPQFFVNLIFREAWSVGPICGQRMPLQEALESSY